MIEHHPKLFHFNSTCEIAIANGSPYFNTTAILNQFEQDLASIMAVFATDNDYILCEEKPTTEFLQMMKSLGLPQVNYISLSDVTAIQTANKSLTFNAHSWGCSPAEDFYLKDVRRIEEQWKADKLPIVERGYVAQLFNSAWLANWNHPLFGSISSIGSSIIRSEQEAAQYLNENLPVVFKSPFSSSGRGLMVLRKPILNDANKKWITTILKQQTYIVASKWLDKQQDLSFQFDATESGLIFEGVSYFNTNTNGQYKEHELNRHNFSIHYNEDTITHMDLLHVGEQLKDVLSQSKLAKLHKGKFGVDALIYKEQDRLKLHPLVEINPRYTMGAVALALQNYIHEESKGFYKIHTVAKESYRDFIAAKQQGNPLVFENNKLKKGVISLTPFHNHSKFGAYLELI
ncbi:MAG: hypothetical protein ACK5MI_02120 [Mangrovibacterium sp.]